MGWEDWINMDFEIMFKFIWGFFFKIVKYPFELFHRLPWWVGTSLWVIIILFALFVLVQLYKRRNEWREHFH